MFLPRQLVIKRPSSTPQTTSRHPSDSCEQTNDRPVKRRRIELDKISEGSAYINSRDATEIVKCLELLFSDYFTQNVSPGWFMKKTRTVDGHHGCT